jgi:hypothetical protein
VIHLLIQALWLSLPLLVGGALHMVVVKLDLWPRLRKPISKRLFGSNKTWRGFVVMPLATVPGVWLVQHFTAPSAPPHFPPGLGAGTFLGLALGLAYALFELPNSGLKRRMGIAPGKRARGAWAPAFVLLDQADSALGCMVVYRLALDTPWAVMAVCLVLGPAVHLVGNLTLFSLGLRKEPT